MSIDAISSHPGWEEVRSLFVCVGDVEFFVPIQLPEPNRANGARGTVKECELNPLAVSVHHKMFELITGPAILAVESRPGAIITAQIWSATSPRAIAHYRCIAWVRRQMKLPPVQRDFDGS